MMKLWRRFIDKEKPVILADDAAKIPEGYVEAQEWPEFGMRLLYFGDVEGHLDAE